MLDDELETKLKDILGEDGAWWNHGGGGLRRPPFAVERRPLPIVCLGKGD